MLFFWGKKKQHIFHFITALENIYSFYIALLKVLIDFEIISIYDVVL